MLKRTELLEQNKKPLSVLARIEIESGVAEFYISAVNLPTNIRNSNFYALVVDSEKKEFEFDLGNRLISFSKTFYQIPSVEKGVAIGLYYISNQIPITIAFANQDKAISLTEFKKLVADKCYLRFKQNIAQEKSDIKTDAPKSDSQDCSIYNDEAVATENYYEIDSEIKQKIRAIKDSDNENLLFENEFADNSSEKKEEEELFWGFGTKDEKDACFSQKIECIEPLEEINSNYYDSVKDELEQIFYTHSSEENLEKIFSQSRWAKIYYLKDKFYVVGLIYEKNKEKYICYGVPSKYSTVPPKELEGYASFIPLSVFDMFGDGYFIMFQDVKTGKCVHFN